MNKFNEVYHQELTQIEEGKFKSLAMAGALAALPAQNAMANSTANKPAIQQVQQIPDSAVINKIKDFTKKSESSTGAKLTAYKCPQGHMTIGYGTNIEEKHNQIALKKLGYDARKLLRKAQQITAEDSEKLLVFGLEQAVRDAREYLPNFDKQPLMVRAVLVDMAYVLGGNKLKKFVDFKAALMARDYKTAVAEMIDSDWYKQTGNRSRALVKMMTDVSKYGG